MMEAQKPNCQSTKKTRRTLYQVFFKRFFDIVLSLLAIILLSPLFLVIWILHKIFIRGGSVIFTQYRPGLNGKIFKIYKFRSMTNEKDEAGNYKPDIYRITTFGKILRKLSLDELPQLFNILKGDMSIVGPRPRMLKDVVFYDQAALATYRVRPGLTGMDQVSNGRQGLSWEDTFAIDEKYASKVTFWRDLWILLKTPFAIFGGSKNGAEVGSKGLYGNYLLRAGKITAEQYKARIKLAKDLSKPHAVLREPLEHIETNQTPTESLN